MNTAVRMKTTRYGLSPRVSGWDSPGDSGTDAWQGNRGNTLNTSSCALTVSAEDLLARSLLDNPDANPGTNFKLTPGRLLRITYLAPFEHLVFYKEFADRAPESDPRLDIFLPWADDRSIPDYGYVSVV